MARAAADDGLFPRAFAWTDRNNTAWFGVVTAALLPSLLMLWGYTTTTGLTVFTDLVTLTVVTVAIPYLFSACAQLAYLVSKRRRVQGWLLARDLAIAGAGGAVLDVGHVRGRLPVGVPGHGPGPGRHHPLRLPQGAPGGHRPGAGPGRPPAEHRTEA